MKKNISIMLILILSTLLLVPVISNAEPIPSVAVFLNGTKLSFDVPPQIMDGSTMVPMRKIFEALEAEVQWDGATQTITAKKDGTTIIMQIDNSVMTKNGQEITLLKPPLLVNDRTLVPVRAIAEAFDADVQWNQEDYIVVISSNGVKMYTAFPNVPDAAPFMDSFIKQSGSEFVYSGSPDQYITSLQENGFTLNSSNEHGKEILTFLENSGSPQVTVKIIYNTEANLSYITLSNDGNYNPQPSITPIPEQTPDPNIPLVNVYSDDCRMASIPETDVQYWVDAGWKTEFPLYGCEGWATDLYLIIASTDIYGTKTFDIFSALPTWNQFTVKWYDDTDFIQINKDEKRLNKLIIEMNGAEYLIPSKDFINGGLSSSSYPHILKSKPQNIPEANWNRIQNHEMWIGMTAREFLLYKRSLPDAVNTYNYGNGETEQWIYRYSSGTEYYYFENSILTSYQK